MPTQTELKQVFTALTENGLDFIERAAAELEKEPKFSVVHFATGLELVLKARLFDEHWSLIAADHRGCTWGAVQSGTQSIQASELCKAITRKIETPLKNQEIIFKTVFDHRNAILHWIPKRDLAQIAAEQCRAWYALHGLIAGGWKDVFAEFQDRIEVVDKVLHGNRTFLEVKYTAIKNKLERPKALGALFPCPACEFDAAVVGAPNLVISEYGCWVCGNSGNAARFHCGYWSCLAELPTLCECKKVHDTQDLLAQLDPTKEMRPKDTLSYGQVYLSCGECLEHQTVAPQGPGFVCCSCGATFFAGDASDCEYCNEQWAGYDTSDSRIGGCEFCDGIDLERD